jgi:predicted DNA-binding protein YlxM (UPF0122 family)
MDSNSRIPDLLDRVVYWKDIAETYDQERQACAAVLEETVEQLRTMKTQLELAQRVAKHNAETAYMAVGYLQAYKAVVMAASDFVDSIAGKHASQALKEAVKGLDKCPTPKA